MTPSPAPRTAAGLSRPRRFLRAVAVLSCLPYLGLKTAWIAGSHLGIPRGSALLDDRLAVAVINGVSVLLDSAVIVLALALTRPWGLRVPRSGWWRAATACCSPRPCAPWPPSTPARTRPRPPG
jgi:hypothetical protein